LLFNQYEESVKVKNNGNIVLTGGVLTVDLPENLLAFVSGQPSWTNWDSLSQTIVWDIPALSVGAENVFKFTVYALAPGSSATTASANFSQAEDTANFITTVSVSHNIVESGFLGSGGEPPIDNNGGNAIIASPLNSSVSMENVLANDGDIETDNSQKTDNGDILLPEELTETENLPDNIRKSVAGVLSGNAFVCPGPPWWLVFVIIILYSITLFLSHRGLNDSPAKYRWYFFSALTIITVLILLALFRCWI
jgi:hypothetical protein